MCKCVEATLEATLEPTVVQQAPSRRFGEVQRLNREILARESQVEVWRSAYEEVAFRLDIAAREAIELKAQIAAMEHRRP